MNRQELFDMKVGDWGSIDSDTSVLRVPDGWIYYRWLQVEGDYHPHGVYVPEQH